jgi:ubiquinone/menaquinone biosynthesis C-methylase UbiE
MGDGLRVDRGGRRGPDGAARLVGGLRGWRRPYPPNRGQRAIMAGNEGRPCSGEVRHVPETSHVSQFSSVDRAADPHFAIRFMAAARALPGIRACKTQVLDELRLVPGATALDVGCGFGADAAEMAARVSPGGMVTGIDRSEVMIDAAHERHAGAGVTLQVGDVTALPFPNASFDACRADTVLQHVPDHRVGLMEMVRVVRPGGRVAGYELDMETFAVDSPHRATTRAIVTSAADAIAQGWAGRQLARLYRAEGLAEVTVTPRAIATSYVVFELVFAAHVGRLCSGGALDPQEAERWWADLRQAEADGRFLAAITAFVVSGTKPGGTARLG